MKNSKEPQQTTRRIFFDTETTGKPLSWDLWPNEGNTHFFPRVVQLAWIETAGEEIVQTCSFIIHLGDVEILEAASAVHGITTEKMKRLGMSERTVFPLFYERIALADQIVCHNVDFDIKMMEAERLRERLFRDNWDEMNMDKTFCTMLEGTDICKLPGRYDDYKWPKLEELHFHLFNEGFDGAHDALNDVRATMRCFFKMEENRANN